VGTDIQRAALPWGYTVVVWTSGGVVIHYHGPPTLLHAYLFLIGAVLALGGLALVGGHARREREHTAARAVLASGVAAALALGAAGAVAAAVHPAAAYLLASFAATLVYFAGRSLL
jgi:hypothetical protein